MTEGIDTRILEPDRVQLALSWFMRGVAAYCLITGIGYWIRLVGFYPGNEWRFDLMPLHWQIAAPALSVLLPFAALGLWLMASWGPVVWLICAAAEGAMFALYPELFGRKPGILVVHTLILSIFLIFFAFLFWRRRIRDQ